MLDRMIPTGRVRAPGGGVRRALVRTSVATALALSAATALSPEPARAFDPRRTGVVVPEILSPEDKSRYSEIFRLQKEGQWKLAEKHILALKDKLLMAHVLHQRYTHPSDYKATYQELREWMVQYRDYPDASRIYELAMKRRPKKAAEPPSPASAMAAMVKMAAPIGPDPLSEKGAVLNAKIYELLDKSQPQAAELLLNEPATKDLLPPGAFDRARADIAMSYYCQGDDGKAYELAAAGAERSSDTVAQAHWTAGLAAYRMGQLETAVFHFGQHARSPAAGPWNVSAGAYWAARVLLQIREPARVEQWLRMAAEHHRTFYGQIARRALGLDSPLDWSTPTVAQEDMDRVMKLPGGRRAIALVQMGELVLAEDELRAHVWKLDATHARSLLAVADAAGLPNTAVRAGTRIAQFGGDAGDRVLYPEPPWTPRNGFKLDRALLFAFMRQESVFYSRATSAVGAVGLMQLMPETAMQISAGGELRLKGQHALYEPSVNLSVGQQYLSWLLARPDITGNIFKTAVAYNAGIGNMRKWEKTINYQGDALLFIESIPSRESRNFVERILANFWIYRERLGQPNPSLDAVVAGEWPRYIAFDRPDVVIAQDVAN